MITPSKYQQVIYDALEHSNDNLAVEAVAGSGKTTTLEHGIHLAPAFNKQCVAFNKHIAVEMKQRGIPACTLHSMGWSILRREIKGVILDARKTENLYKSMFDMGKADERSKFYKTKGTVGRIISLLKANSQFSFDPNFVSELIDVHGLDFDPDMQMLGDLYTRCLSLRSIVDFDDQIFFPVYLDMKVPLYDLLMVDESQDLNPVQIDLVLRAGSRTVCVGDSWQAIYGFRGANPEAIAEMVKRTNARTLPLSICWRCPKAVVREAQKIVSHIEYAPNAPEGLVEDFKQDKYPGIIKEGDYVLCRTTAPLVSECLRMIRDGRKATVKGREIGAQLNNLIEKFSKDERMPIRDFEPAIQKYRMEQTARLESLGKDYELGALNDRVDTIMALAEGVDTVGAMQEKIDSIFKDEATGIVYCTVHKSKGLQAKNIMILKPEQMPFPKAKKDWQIKQEHKLKYVAVTRAQETLRFLVR